MKKRRPARSGFAKLRVIICLLIFFVSAYLLLVASPTSHDLDGESARHSPRQPDRATNHSIAPAGSVYEAWVARYNGPLNAYDIASAVAVDNFGNVYVGGQSWGVTTREDYTIIKYNPAGNEEWVARYNGTGNGDDQLGGLVVDGSGNVYVTGFSVSDNQSHFDCVTIKYNSAGQQQWLARYTAPSGYASGDGIALDNSGNVYVAAEGAIPSDANHRFCVTIKYDGAGQQQWAEEYDGGMNSNLPTGIAVDGSSNVYVTGNILSCPTFEYLTLKYNSAGQEQWVTRYQGPGTGGDSANAIAVDESGNVYVTGDSYTSGISSSTVKYVSTGQQEWVARDEHHYYEAHALTIDGASNVYLTGEIRDEDAYPDYGTIKYNSAGQVQWVARYGAPSASSYDRANAIALDAAGNVYVTGRSAGSGIYGYPDYVTIKYDSIGRQQWVARYDGGGNTGDEAVAIAVDKSGNVYVTGTSNGDFVTIKYAEGAPPTPSVAPTVTPTPTSTATPTPTASVTPGTPTPTPPEPPNTPTATPTATATPVKVCAQYVTRTGTGPIVPGTVDIGNHCDNCLTSVSFPFPVQFYGSTINAAYVNSNGSLQLTGDMTRFGVSCPLPDRCLDAAILVYQDDLRTDGPGSGVFTSVSGTMPNRIFNIEWRTTYFGRPGSANFEVRFYENQTFFDLIYGISDEIGASAASGVQQGTLGGRYAGFPATFSCGTPALTNGLKVTYTFERCTPRPRPTPHPRP